MRAVGITLLIAALAGAGCSSSPPVGTTEKLCRQSVISQLLNPETVEFFEFAVSNRDSYWETAVKEQVQQLQAARPQSSINDIESAVMTAVSQSLKEKRDPVFYHFRIKADGKLGNKITSQMQCVVSDGSCACAGS